MEFTMGSLITNLVDKSWWAIISFAGGAMLARLWIGKVFRSEYTKHHKEIANLQHTYNGLCWQKQNDENILPKVYFKPFGQFNWGEIRTPLKLCIWFFKSEDRQAIRKFLQLEEYFKEQPDYTDQKIRELLPSFKKYLPEYIFCLDLMNNLGNVGTNNGYNFINEVSVFTRFNYNENQAAKDYKYYLDNRSQVEDSPQLMELLKACSK